MPSTTYSLSVNSRPGPNLTCFGITETIMVTTLTIEAGVPKSELIVVNKYVQYIAIYVYVTVLASKNLHSSHQN